MTSHTRPMLLAEIRDTPIQNLISKKVSKHITVLFPTDDQSLFEQGSGSGTLATYKGLKGILTAAHVAANTIGAAVAIGVGYMACWSVQKMIDQGSLQKDSPTYTLTTGVIGGLAGSMIQTQPGTFSGNYPGPYISSTGYPSFITVIKPIDGYDFTFLDKKGGERRSSNEPGSPPVRGEQILGDGTNSPTNEFDNWKGRGPPGSGNGSWVKGSGKTKESLHPDLHHPEHGPHWDYEGPNFPDGARIYPDGTWEPK